LVASAVGAASVMSCAHPFIFSENCSVPVYQAVAVLVYYDLQQVCYYERVYCAAFVSLSIANVAGWVSDASSRWVVILAGLCGDSAAGCYFLD